MRSLLKLGARRRLDIVEFLNDTDDWILPEQIAKALHCSVKTIDADLEFFMNEWSDILTIEYSKRFGFRLTATSSGKIEHIYKKAIQESDEFAFLEQVFFDTTQNGEYWMKRLYHSEATFYRFLRKIDAALEERELVLDRHPLKVSSTDEKWVRGFFADYFYERYGLNDWPFDFDRQLLYQFIQRFMNDFNSKLSDRRIGTYCYLLAVSLERQLQGFLLVTEDQEPDLIEELIAPSKSLILESLGERAAQLPPSWVRDLLLTTFHGYYGWDNEAESLRIKRNLSRFLNEISQEIKVGLQSSDRQEIIAELMLVYTRQKFYPHHVALVDNYRYLVRDVYRFYPRFTDIFMKHARKLEKRTGFPWYSSKGSRLLHVVFTIWSDLPFQLEIIQEKCHVLVYSDIQTAHLNLLGKFIDNSFHHKVEVSLCHQSYYFLTSADIAWMNSFDLVITTEAMPFLDDEKQVVVEYLPSQKDFSTIARAIERKHWLKIYRYS